MSIEVSPPPQPFLIVAAAQKRRRRWWWFRVGVVGGDTMRHRAHAHNDLTALPPPAPRPLPTPGLKPHLYPPPSNTAWVIVVCDPDYGLVLLPPRELEELCSPGWAGTNDPARAPVTCSPVVCGGVRRPLPEQG